MSIIGIVIITIVAIWLLDTFAATPGKVMVLS